MPFPALNPLSLSVDNLAIDSVLACVAFRGAAGGTDDGQAGTALEAVLAELRGHRRDHGEAQVYHAGTQASISRTAAGQRAQKIPRKILKTAC